MGWPKQRTGSTIPKHYFITCLFNSCTGKFSSASLSRSNQDFELDIIWQLKHLTSYNLIYMYISRPLNSRYNRCIKWTENPVVFYLLLISFVLSLNLGTNAAEETHHRNEGCAFILFFWCIKTKFLSSA